MAFSLQRQPRTQPKFFDRIFGFIETRKASDRVLLKFTLFAFFVSLIFVLFFINRAYLVEVPHTGGKLVEGTVGTPRFVNPLLAVTPADKDIAALVYAGLMRLGGDGGLVADMADSITVSEDGLTYNVILKQGLTFHDGSGVTADDVIFTIARTQDPALKSPLLSSWEGVTTERINDHEFNIILPKPYAPFLENLTLGILPKHIWEEASADAFPFSQYNSEPVGSGPLKIERIVRSKSGIPESYVLTPFAGYTNPPQIETFELVFYSNESALIEDFRAGKVGSVAGLSPESVTSLGDLSLTHNVYVTPLPRTFGVFMNQNEAPVFRDRAVREALALVTDRTPIIETVLGGYGYSISGPLPPKPDAARGAFSESPTLATIDAAREILRNGGWKVDDADNRWKKKMNDTDVELAFTLATANSVVLEKTAALLKEQWEKIGAVVEVLRYEQVDLTQTVIRPRKFDALLFGTVIGRELDFYPFWHSSQRNDPGLNIALFANIETDATLSLARVTGDYNERMQKNDEFAKEIAADIPAIFLYSPALTYIVPKNVERVSLRGVAEPHERFSTVSDWYTEVESVWSLFK